MDLMASIFGGGSQTAPVLPTINPNAIAGQFLGQDFGKATNIANTMSTSVSNNNLSNDIAGINRVDSGALTGLNARQTLGNGLLSGDSSALPAWAQQYLNDGARQGAESAVGRGVGAFSSNGMSGVNQFMGNNALQLVGFGNQLSTGASQEAEAISGRSQQRFNPTDFLLNPGQFLQAGEFNAGIQGQNEIAKTTALNYNRNNSPLGNAFRTGLSMVASLAGSYLGDPSLGQAFSTSSNGASGPIGGSYGGGSGGGGGAGIGTLMGMI